MNTVLMLTFAEYGSSASVRGVFADTTEGLALAYRHAEALMSDEWCRFVAFPPRGNELARWIDSDKVAISRRALTTEEPEARPDERDLGEWYADLIGATEEERLPTFRR